MSRQTVIRRRVRQGFATATLVTRTCVVRALAVLAVLCGVADASVKINEVHYHPPSPDGKTLEFVELVNTADVPVSLAGWRLTGGVEFDFDFGNAVSIEAGGFLVVARDRVALLTAFDLEPAAVLGNYRGAIDNDGDELILVDEREAFIDDLDFDDRLPWPEAADGSGPSLQRLCVDAPANLASNWAATSGIQPTPARANPGLVCPPPAVESPRIVINEIHYHPGGDREQLEEFVELHNPGDETVDVSGWRMVGLGFLIPDGTAIPAGGYLAICRNAENIRRTFGIDNAIGDFTSKLANSGERLSLVDSAGVVVDVVRYRDHGDWSYLTDGEGHSLEKIDPLADGGDPASWSRSQLRPGDFVEMVAVGKLSGLLTQRLAIGVNGAAEFIVDDVVFASVESLDTNLIENGDFENDLEGWTTRGNATTSVVEESIGVGDSRGLRLLVTGGCGETCEECGSRHSVYRSFSTGDLDTEVDYQLTVRFRYISGSPRFYCHLLRGAAACVGGFLASPGRENGARSDVLPPFISQRGRFPIEPRPGEPSWISALVRVPSGQGIEAVELEYIVGDEVGTLAMADDGQSGDASPGDGVYGVQMPWDLEHDTVVLYRILARTVDGQSAIYPRTRHEEESRREDFAGYYVNENQPDSNLPIYHLLLPNLDPTDPAAINLVLDCERLTTGAFACRGEVYPEILVRNRGNTACILRKRNLKLRFNRGRYFRDVRKINLQGMWTDKSLVREHLAWDFIGQLGIPYCETEFIRVHLNGQYHGLFLYLEHPDGRYLERNGLDGDDCLYKARQPPRLGGPVEGVTEQSSLERYGDFWEQETCEDGDLGALSDFIGDLHTDSRGADGPTAEFFGQRSLPEHVIGYQLAQTVLNNIDSFAKNHFLYWDVDMSKWSVLTWDMDLVFGKFFDPEIDPVGTLNDCMLSPNSLELNPWFATSVRGNIARHHFVDFFFNAGDGFYQRAYLVRLSALLREKYRNEVYDPMIDDLAVLLEQEQADDLERWGRSAVGCAPNCGGICADEMSMAGNIIEVKRQLGLHRDFLLDYVAAVHPEIPGYDRMKITELMFNPVGATSDLEFIELLNTSGREIDLSEWAITGGISFVFDRGVTVPADGMVIVTKSRDRFLARYPGVESRAQVFGDYVGALSDGGETIRLVDGGEAGQSYPATIDVVSYADGGDWPHVIPGHSIELSEVSDVRDNDFGASWELSPEQLGTPGILREGTQRRFLRGDAAEDGAVNLSDAVKILGYLFLQDTSLTCLDAADADDDGSVLLTDATYVLNFLFRGGSPPPLPFPDAGLDTSEDELACP